MWKEGITYIYCNSLTSYPWMTGWLPSSTRSLENWHSPFHSQQIFYIFYIIFLLFNTKFLFFFFSSSFVKFLFWWYPYRQPTYSLLSFFFSFAMFGCEFVSHKMCLIIINSFFIIHLWVSVPVSLKYFFVVFFFLFFTNLKLFLSHFLGSFYLTLSLFLSLPFFVFSLAIVVSFFYYSFVFFFFKKQAMNCTKKTRISNII